jgi:hypothetical protein
MLRPFVVLARSIVHRDSYEILVVDRMTIL